MELTRKTEYAIAVLSELAVQNKDHTIQSREIAEKRSIPPNLVPQIVAALSKKGWIEGTRGVGGGVRMAAEPSSISILDVIELVEGPIYINRCLQQGTCSSEHSCSLRRVWVRAQDALLNVFRDTTIADLVAEKGKQ